MLVPVALSAGLLGAADASAAPMAAPAEVRGEHQTTQLDGWAASAYPADERASNDRDQHASADRAAAPFRLFADPNSLAGAWADAHPRDPRAARISSRIASVPTGTWLVGDGAKRRTARVVRKAARRRQVPVLVLYNIPRRDCHGQSSGGTATARKYRRWVDGIATALRGRRTIVVVEPDALAGMDCLSARQADKRLSLLRNAVKRLRSRAPRSFIYLDAGHAGWQRANVMSDRLERAGVARARGFVLNVGNFRTTNESSRYGTRIVKKLKRKVGRRVPFVVDTSRNGTGPPPSGSWCNPAGVRVGAAPAVRTLGVGLEMTLWVKPPGESDGFCGSAASAPAGTFAPDLALTLLEQ